MKIKNKIKYPKFLISAIIVVVFAVACLSFVRAQTSEELGIPTAVQVSPIRFNWDLEDGDEKTGTINLKNYSDLPYEVIISVENFYVSDDSTEAKFFIPDERHPLKAYDVINWVELPEQIKLAPKEGRDISFKVKVPEGTPTGGYYGALFFQTKAIEGSGEQAIGGGSQIIVNQRVATLLIMAVKGDEPIRRSGELVDFSPKSKIFWDTPATLIAQVKNSGNLHYRAFGKIEIEKFGKKHQDIELNPRLLYPDRIRTYEEESPFSAWGYGFYKAKINLTSENQEIKMSGETTYWVIPWKTTASIILLILSLWIIYKIFTSRFEIKIKGKDDKPNSDEEVVIEEKNFDNDANQESQVRPQDPQHFQPPQQPQGGSPKKVV